ncbi:DUF5996 family protein [Streptomyces sp. SBT349]|uniref:DUF5996 family protein n=1 Tax=Streptomyces sp. SBT349 TaxID=1580539 RepID=UPI00066C9FC2|nr:DUF5996 family protein [Streptomyces sp. SBT349]
MTDARHDTGRAGDGWEGPRVADWRDTRDTLHMWLQIVGKIRLARSPMVNHWWGATLYVTPRGLTTSAVPYGRRFFDIEFDFCSHQVLVRSSDGGERRVALEAKPVSLFHAEIMAALRELDLPVSISTTPTEVEPAIPFEDDRTHAAYDPAPVTRFRHQLLQAHRVFTDFRTRFIGKASPVHFFWGSMDLAVTRYSGRPAPAHPCRLPHCGDWVMVEAYSHEVSSCGFWPGGGEEGAFYSYAYPEPTGFAQHPVRPAAAAYDPGLGEFVLPYEAVRTAPDPEAALLDFLQTTYEAAANLGDWDRQALEDDPARRADPRRGSPAEGAGTG